MLKIAAIAVLCFALAAGEFEHEKNLWNAYKRVFNKNYGQEEDSKRMEVFLENRNNVMIQNMHYEQGSSSFKMGINQFSDMSQEEVKETMNGYRGSTANRTGLLFKFEKDVKVDETVDWRKKGLVTGVKNQAQCGSCWAFSTTGSLEGQHKKKTGKLVSLSEQNLVDCSGAEGDQGCNGGLMDNAFTYIKKNNGIDTEASYPYRAVDGRCHFKKSTVGATVTGFVDIPSGNEDALKKAAATIGPISVAIDANHPEFMGYKSGILDIEDCSSTELDHGVLVVGYGSENGRDYWLVKNSWGESWGMSGYVKMARNMHNQCGIATSASYPLV